MSTKEASRTQTKTQGAVKGGGGRYIFPLTQMAGIVHYTIATPEEDVIFFAVKDLSHGIIGIPADGKALGGHYDPGFEPGKA
jgi:hypothetical protein